MTITIEFFLIATIMIDLRFLPRENEGYILLCLSLWKSDFYLLKITSYRRDIGSAWYLNLQLTADSGAALITFLKVRKKLEEYHRRLKDVFIMKGGRLIYFS